MERGITGEASLCLITSLEAAFLGRRLFDETGSLQLTWRAWESSQSDFLVYLFSASISSRTTYEAVLMGKNKSTKESQEGIGKILSVGL